MSAADTTVRILRAIPLLGFALIFANLLALLSAGFDTDLLAFTMPSGGELVLRAGHLVVLVGLALLTVELLKNARRRAPAAELAGSAIVFAVALLEFLMLARFAHGGFLILALMSLVDVVVGMVPPRHDDART